MEKLLSVKLSKALYDAIHTHAVQNDLSASQVVRHAIRAHINYVEPAPNIVSTTERPRKLSPAEQAALDAEVDREAREAWLREGNQTTERPRKLSPTKTLEEVRAMWVNDD
jgi:predicted transcriptional regulator